ncbi:hypothetical protein ARAM_002351 [Aspergillus rambellii]|uniref:Cytochrome P450 n=1 Tax=Aspergillus rambellii TaxID=308745 RepID=A0A0F8X4B4_9EURO|nr:hypothetical protein ARAM_002351 [Aspergillus rambellii]
MEGWVYLTGLATGIITHIAYLHHGEHHKYGLAYLLAFLAAVTCSAYLLVFLYDQLFRHALFQSLQFYAAYLAGLYSSLLVYRIFLNPLNKFPSSLGTRISLCFFSLRLKDLDSFRQLHRLHKKHGHFVRLGPSDVSITHPDAILAIHGPGSRCTKASQYDIVSSFKSLQTLRDKGEHAQRRRLWSSAFGEKALRGYEHRIRGHRQRFMNRIMEEKGNPINITDWFMWYSFDVMGDLAFGQHFGMLDNGQQHWAIQLLFDSIHYLGYNLPSWMFILLNDIPGVNRDWWRFIGYCQQTLEKRLQHSATDPDFCASFLAPLQGRKPNTSEMNLLVGDTQLLIIAGSDTVAIALTSIIYLLCQNREHIELLRYELAPLMTDPTGEVLHEKIAHLDHLNGVINEGLRLYPPVPTGFIRLTPPEGITIGGTYIPGHTSVQCPLYVIGRCEEIYPQAETFLPERWYRFPDMVKYKNAFAPFAIGPYSCIGKPLALMNIRTTLARMIYEFDFGFAPSEDGTQFEKNAVEHVTFSMGELKLGFTPRKNADHF